MIEVKQITKEEWKSLGKTAHEVVFKEAWNPDLDRIDFALITVDSENTLIQYATIREIDATRAFIFYGGSFPTYRGSISALRSFEAILAWLFERYERVRFVTNRNNKPMLKFAIHKDFILQGTELTDEGNLLIIFEKRRA